MTDLKRSMQDAADSIKRSVRKAAEEQNSSAEGRSTNVNVAHHSNVVIAHNVGSDDAVQQASSRQRVHTRQSDGRTVEDVAVTESKSNRKGAHRHDVEQELGSS